MATKKFPSELSLRGTVLPTDKLLIHNITTGATEYTTVANLLTFPAVRVPNANVNALDDYKEGTWVPVLRFGGASVGITYTAQVGRYTKIGNIVFITGHILLSNKGTSTGDVMISGLPYTIPNNTANYAPLSLWLNSVTFANQVQSLLLISSTTLLIGEITEAGVRTILDNTNFANDSDIVFSGFYIV